MWVSSLREAFRADLLSTPIASDSERFGSEATSLMRSLIIATRLSRADPARSASLVFSLESCLSCSVCQDEARGEELLAVSQVHSPADTGCGTGSLLRIRAAFQFSLRPGFHSQTKALEHTLEEQLTLLNR